MNRKDYVKDMFKVKKNDEVNFSAGHAIADHIVLKIFNKIFEWLDIVELGSRQVWINDVSDITKQLSKTANVYDKISTLIPYHKSLYNEDSKTIYIITWNFYKLFYRSDVPFKPFKVQSYEMLITHLFQRACQIKMTETVINDGESLEETQELLLTWANSVDRESLYQATSIINAHSKEIDAIVQDQIDTYKDINRLHYNENKK